MSPRNRQKIPRLQRRHSQRWPMSTCWPSCSTTRARTIRSSSRQRHRSPGCPIRSAKLCRPVGLLMPPLDPLLFPVAWSRVPMLSLSRAVVRMCCCAKRSQSTAVATGSRSRLACPARAQPNACTAGSGFSTQTLSRGPGRSRWTISYLCTAAHWPASATYSPPAWRPAGGRDAMQLGR